MATFLAIVGWTCFFLAIIAGLALDAVGLFGNWIILGAITTTWAVSGLEHFGIWSLLLLTVLAILGEVIEFLAAGFGASRFGGSKGSMFSVLAGCIVGAIVGTPWLPIVGTLIGACLGAFVAALAYELIVMQRQVGEAAWTGFGAALGKIGGLLAKLAIGLVMLIVAALTY